MPFVMESEHPPLRVDEHGTVRISATRATLDTVIGTYRDGSTPEQIVLQYPSLSLADVYATIAYYLRHTEHVDEYLAGRKREADELRRKIEANPDMQRIRQRLAAIKASTERARPV